MFFRSNMTKVEVHGLDGLEANLLAIGKITATKAGEHAMLQAAEIMEAAISAMAPSSVGAGSRKSWLVGVGPRVKTSTITMTMTARGLRLRRKGTTFRQWRRKYAHYGKLKNNIVSRVVPADKPGQVKVVTGTGNAFWGLFIERGTKARFTGVRAGTKAHRGKMMANPFMAPAFDMAAPRILRILGEQIEHSIRRVLLLERLKQGPRQ